MSKVLLESVIKVNEKEYVVEEILKSVIYYPAEKVKELFFQINLRVPRKLRMDALSSVLHNSVLQTLEERRTLADELGYRLTWFNKYSELQLENLLEHYNNNSLKRTYLLQLWIRLLNYFVDKKVPNEVLDNLIADSIAHIEQEGLVLPKTKKYNETINGIFFDENGEIDGLTPEQIRPVLYKSSTITEVRELGRKYQVDVPKRLRKNEFANIVIQELKDRGEHTDELEQEIRKMTILVMQRYAINNNIKMSTELKKEEVIEYVLANAKETKETYYVPSATVYDVELEHVEVKRDEVVPVDVVEDEIIPEPEKEVVVERVKEVFHDNSEIIQKLDEIKEEITQIKNKPVVVQSGDYAIEDHVLEINTDIFINTADFVGNKKQWKQTNKLLKTEVEEIVEEKEEIVTNQQPCCGSYETYEQMDDDKHPVEVRFFLKVLKIILIIAIIVLVLFVIYAVVTNFVKLEFLDGFNETLNKVKIGGKGILDIIWDLFN